MGNMNIIPKKWPRTLFPAVFLCCVPLVLYSAEEAFEIPRTEHGYPDLQGYWSNLSQTPLQRPRELGNKRAYTEEEALALVTSATDAAIARDRPLDSDRAPPPAGAMITNKADDDFDAPLIDIAKVHGEYRTSLIIEPPDGRLPIMENPAPTLRDKRVEAGAIYLDGPELAGLNDRCILPGPKLSLMAQIGLSPYAQIVQTKDYIMLLGEYPYLPRIIRLNSEHPAKAPAKWMGDSVGHWEGDSLVVHTNSFHPEQQATFPRGSEELEIIEVFSVTAADTLLYRYTVTDPLTYTSSFTAEIPLQRMPPGHVLYEYACHEGNYSFEGMLAGARRTDVEAERLAN